MWLKVFFTGVLFLLISSALAPVTYDHQFPRKLRATIMLSWLGSVLMIIVSILGFIWS